MFKKLLVVSVLICIISFLWYLYTLHALALEGNRIFEYRCLHVNPILIGYKKAFLGYADWLNSYPNTNYSEKDLKNFIDGYMSGLRKYVPAEETWLAMDGAFINRWDYRLIEPWYIQKAGVLQYEMYAAYRTDAANMVGLMDHPEAAKNSLYGPNPARDKLDAAIEKYFDFYRQAVEISDWRKYFGRVSVPNGCTKESITIPNTNGSINWDRGSESTPSGAPMDPYLTS